MRGILELIVANKKAATAGAVGLTLAALAHHFGKEKIMGVANSMFRNKKDDDFVHVTPPTTPTKK